MKYICFGYSDEKAFETMSDKDRNKFIDEAFAYDEQMQKGGHVLGGEGLQSSRITTTLRYANGKVSITDGPFTETKEQIGGILTIEARDLNQAIQLMSKHPSLRYGSSWEIRPAEDL